MLEALKLESPPARPENIIIYVHWTLGEWDRDRERVVAETFLRHREGIEDKGNRTWEMTPETASFFWEWLERHNNFWDTLKGATKQ